MSDSLLSNPWVYCDAHAGMQLGYMVCRHITDESELPLVFDRASEDHLGLIACRRAHDGPVIGEYRLICARCVHAAWSASDG